MHREIQPLLSTHPVTVEVISGEELKEKGFGGIYGVGKASSHPPAMVILRYSPQGASKKVCWVGKGIVFDTGGLSIKRSVMHVFMYRAQD